MEKLSEDRIKRQIEVEKELAQVRESLIDALNSKIDYLDNAISKSNDNIAKYVNRIADLSSSWHDMANKLADSTFWQEEYTKSIQKESQALENLTDKRASVESQIASLDTRLQRDKLQAYLESVKMSKDEMAISGAQRELDEFDRKQSAAEMAAREIALANLRLALPKLIEDQEAAKHAFAAASDAARTEISYRKLELEMKMNSARQEREQLLLNIETEKHRIQLLTDDRVATEALLDMLGVKRQTELEKMNSTIEALIVRGLKLEEERDALSSLTGIAKESIDIFDQLSDAFTRAAGSARAAVASLGHPITPASPRLPAAPTVPAGTGGTSFLNFGVPNTSGNATGTGILGSGLPEFWNPFLGVPQYAEGGISPRRELAIVDAGEWHIPRSKQEQMMAGSGPIVLQLTVNTTGEFNADKFVQEIDMNKGRIKEKLRSALAIGANNRNRLAYK